tara:strand:+ start:4644 stop:4838 length:195 start_codon:yes stop_codon:yes gene_type:complete
MTRKQLKPLKDTKTSTVHKVYVLMNDLGINSVYPTRKKADKRAKYVQERYSMKHWVETWEMIND